MNMQLTALQKRICEQVINVFETGKIAGDYGALVIFADGPHDIRQITYGRSQTTEYGNLEELVQMYVDANGTFSEPLRPFIAQIGVTPLVDNKEFKQLLRDAGRKDPVMQRIQDEFFDKRYFQPAMRWADTNEFTMPLSALVISIHSSTAGVSSTFSASDFPKYHRHKAATKKPGYNNTWMYVTAGW
jgi:chitosanase